MGWLIVTIVFLICHVGPTYLDKKVPNSIRQIIPVNSLRYIVESPF